MVVLLADDERMIRFALKSMLLDIMTEDCSIYEAADGREMIEMCALHKPSIAFVDINMPRQDGISAIRQCQEISPGTHFIVLTGYDSFEYARECLRLQIVDYILKPIDANKLRELYEKLKDKLLGDMRVLNTGFQTRIIQLFGVLQEIGLDEEDASYFNTEGGAYFGALFFIERAPDPTAYARVYKALIHQLDRLGAKLLHDDFFYATFYFGEGTLALIIRGKNIATKPISESIRELCEKIGAEYDARVFFDWDTAEDIVKLYESCARMEENKYVSMGAGTSKQRKAADKIDAITQYIDKNYMHDVSINMLAEKFEMTPNYLSRIFREKKQANFIEYLTSVRINNAKKVLLRSPDISIKDLTLMVGYYNPRYFARIFKNATGVYPSDFKKA